MAALMGGGVALGRGVVGMANARSQPSQVVSAAPVTEAQPTAQEHPAAAMAVAPPQPTFTSHLRSWAAAAPAIASTPSPSEAPVSIAEPQSVTAETATYTVAAGDTLSQIAARFGTDTAALVRANKLGDPNILVPGTRIAIPAAGAYTAAGAASTARPAASIVTIGPVLDGPAATESATTPPTVPPVNGPASPAYAVRSFYEYLNEGQFTQAAELWSPRMRSAYPPAQNINSRFARTQALTLSQADVVQVDTASGRATVAVHVSEVVGPPVSTREYVGNWYLVRGASGWLLDEPSLEAH